MLEGPEQLPALSDLPWHYPGLQMPRAGLQDAKAGSWSGLKPTAAAASPGRTQTAPPCSLSVCCDCGHREKKTGARTECTPTQLPMISFSFSSKKSAGRESPIQNQHVQLRLSGMREVNWLLAFRITASNNGMQSFTFFFNSER